MTKVFVIILNFNGGQNTIECLKSLDKIRIPKDTKVEPLVVDNGSRDDSVLKIKKEFPKLTLVENQTNLGFTGGNNEAMRMAIAGGADFVMLLNNDTVVDSGLVENLLKPFEHDTVGAVVPKIYFEKGYEFHKNRYKESDRGKIIWYAGGKMDWSNLIGENVGVDEIDRGQFDVRCEIELATGCCIMIRANVLARPERSRREKVGLFDDRYFLYYEDADLSQKVKWAGYKIIFEPKAILWHKNAESSGVGSDLHDYYITRNRLLFGMTYAPMRTKIALLRESLKLLTSGRKWQRRGVMDFYLRRFTRGSFPI